MPKNQMTKILEDPLRHENLVHGYGGVLAGLFARILFEMNITVPRWLSLMNDFVNDARNGAQTENQKDRTSMRGNLTKEFSRSQMTWKVFLKGLRFLQVVKFKLTITAYHATGKVTQHHSKVINLGGRQELGALLRNLDTPDEADMADEDYVHYVQEVEPGSGKKRRVAVQVPETPENRWVEEHSNAIAGGQQDMFEQDPNLDQPMGQPSSEPASKRQRKSGGTPYDEIID